jgi:hypothetical protein
MNIMMAQNQGMRSRFTQQFEIKDWSIELCYDFIVEQLELRYCILNEQNIKDELKKNIKDLKKLGNFANGRDCKNIAIKISEFAYSNKPENDGNVVVSNENIQDALGLMITNRSPEDEDEDDKYVGQGEEQEQEQKYGGSYHQFVAKEF